MAKCQVHIWLPPETFSALKALAKTTGRSFSMTICEMAEAGLNINEGGPIDPENFSEMLMTVRLLEQRSKYLVRASNMLMRHHPAVNLLDIMKQVADVRKADPIVPARSSIDRQLPAQALEPAVEDHSFTQLAENTLHTPQPIAPARQKSGVEVNGGRAVPPEAQTGQDEQFKRPTRLDGPSAPMTLGEQKRRERDARRASIAAMQEHEDRVRPTEPNFLRSIQPELDYGLDD